MNVKIELKTLLLDLKKEIESSKNFEDIKLLKSKYLNKNNKILEIRKSFHSLNDEDKRLIGGQVKEFTTTVETLLNDSKKAIELKIQEESIAHINTDLLNIDVIKFSKGTKHPLSIASDIIKGTLIRLGYSFISPQEIETTENNFDKLNIEKEHSSRSKNDTFYFNNKLILRPHCTNMTARYMETCKDDQIKAFTIGKTYRNDADDATHSHQFMQIDLFNISKNRTASLDNLKWVLTRIFEDFFGDKNIEVRFRPSYFPFTTPSYEVDIICSSCKGKGCNICKKTGWIEVLGAGMLHPKVIKASGKGPKEYSGFAAGIGLERLAMLKWNIDDIRHFYINHIDFLKQFKK